MSANTPFLARFARSASEGESHATGPKNGTLITKVARETTDDS